MPLVSKSLQWLVNQNSYIQVNALQLVDLGMLAVKHAPTLTGTPHNLEVDFTFRESFTFYFIFSIQFCFAFS